jgi:integrase
VTEASAAGATDREIMQQTGHASVAMVHCYTRADQQDQQKTTRKLKLFRAGKGGKDGDLGAEGGR